MSIDPSLKAYVSEAQQLAAATYQCPVCAESKMEDGVMYARVPKDNNADGSWILGGKKGTQKTRILQWKCKHCGATLRRTIKEEANADVKPTPTQDSQPNQEVANAH